VIHFAAVLSLACWSTYRPLRGTRLAGSSGPERLALDLQRRLVVQVIIRHRFNVDLVDRLFYCVPAACRYVLALIRGLGLFGAWRRR